MKSIKQIFRTLMLPAFALAMFAGCNGDDPEGLAVTYIPEKIAAEGGKASFTVYPGAFDRWTVTLPQGVDWIEVDTDSGSGETAVTITVKPNTSFGEREAIVVVTAADRDIPVTIVQSGAAVVFEVNPESLTDLPGDEGEEYIARSLEVTANIEWYAEIMIENASPTYGDWVMFLPGNTSTHGSAAEPVYGDAQLDLYIGNYQTIGAPLREAKVLFYDTNGELLQEVPISQGAPAIIFEVNPESLAGLPDNENSQYIARSLEVTANIEWYAEIVLLDVTTRNWVLFLLDHSLTYASAEAPVYGDAQIDLYIGNFYPDVGTPYREANVRFFNANGELLKEVPISQGTQLFTFRVSPEILEDLPYNGANYDLTVTADISWYAEITPLSTYPQTDYIWFMSPAGDKSLNHGTAAAPVYGNAALTLSIGQFLWYDIGLYRVASVKFYNEGGTLLKDVHVSQLSSKVN